MLSFHDYIANIYLQRSLIVTQSIAITVFATIYPAIIMECLYMMCSLIDTVFLKLLGCGKISLRCL